VLEKNLTRFVLGTEFELLNVRPFRDGHLWVVQKRRSAFEICPRCGDKSSTRAGRCKALLRDEPLREQALWLEVHKHRYFCRTCRKPFTETTSLSWPKRRTTYRLRKHVAKLCHDMTDLGRVRKRTRMSNGFIYKVYYDQIEIRLRERRDTLKWPSTLGIDEHFFSRSRGFTEYVTVFTDLRKRKLFEVARGKDTRTLIEQIESIPGREQVREVVIDMSGTYRALIKKLFPQAKIIADKFHVLRLLSPSIIKERRLVQGNVFDARTRRRLLMNRPDLDYFERSEIDVFLRRHPTLDALYRAKEKLHEVYRTHGYLRAERGLDRLIEDLRSQTIEPLKRLGRTLKNWKKEILEYFKTRLTNAFTEQTNNRGKLVQKRGYGYRSFRNYRLRLLSACLHEGYAL
jgi:transposase